MSATCAASFPRAGLRGGSRSSCSRSAVVGNGVSDRCTCGSPCSTSAHAWTYASSSDSDDCVVLVYRDGSKVDKETPAHTASSKRGATFDERFWLAGPRFAIRPLDRPALLERAVRVLGGKRARRQLRRVLPPFLLRSGLPALCSLPNQRVPRVPHLPLLRPKREDPSPRAAFWVQPLANWTGKANLL